jgi:hypothetical protein
MHCFVESAKTQWQGRRTPTQGLEGQTKTTKAVISKLSCRGGEMENRQRLHAIAAAACEIRRWTVLDLIRVQCHAQED